MLPPSVTVNKYIHFLHQAWRDCWKFICKHLHFFVLENEFFYLHIFHSRLHFLRPKSYCSCKIACSEFLRLTSFVSTLFYIGCIKKLKVHSINSSNTSIGS
uniref:Uncharacterized protein n=1 Tax=Davidia involucrata TaxID=16924 RepID=A0A5B7BZ45_DAVIN